MKFLAVAIALLAAQPAYACHRFSRWAFPYPQRCGAAPAFRAEVKPKLVFVAPAKVTDIPLTDADPARMALRMKLQ